MLKMYESNYDQKYLAEFLQASQLYIKEDHIYKGFIPKPVLNLHIITEPDMYLKQQNIARAIGKQFTDTYQSLTLFKIEAFKVRPELSKFQILNNPIKQVFTPWEQVNRTQNILINQLTEAKEVVEYENIGNTSRKLLKQLADAVFIPEKHIAPANVKVGSEEYKNRLHTYILTEVGDTRQNEEYMSCVDAIINTATKSVDLSNKVTHDSKGYRVMVESCVISVITVVNLIKTIHANKAETASN